MSDFIEKRLRQLIYFTQLLVVLALINNIFFSSVLDWRDNIDIPALITIFILLSTLHQTINYNQQITINLFLYLLMLAVFFLALTNEGVASSVLLGYPFILSLAAWLGSPRTFKVIFFVAFACILLLGYGDILGWFDNLNTSNDLVNNERIINSLLLIIMTGYVSYIFSQDMKKAFEDLKNENSIVVKSRQTIKLLAQYDSLTGLLNRSAGEEHYINIKKSINPYLEKIVLYYIDLDDFKYTNDSFDHSIGDKLLIVISERLKRSLGKQSFACRVGGDEFLIFTQCDKNYNSHIFAENLLQIISRPHYIYSNDIKAQTTASVGITEMTDDISFDEIRKQADIAMYKAKHLGKNRYYQYDEQASQEHLRKIQILSGIQAALKNNHLVLHFQPKVNLENGDIMGAEALLRWEVSNTLQTQPQEFIPIIEATEIIHDVGIWVIEEACKVCKGWHNKGHPITISVNVSSAQFTRSTFFYSVKSILEQYSLPAQYLEIELTEHLLLHEDNTVKDQLQLFKKMGVLLAIDDFGTGYSNLDYLTRFQVNTLKLDHSFISKICLSNNYLTIVTAIIRMAQVLDIKVVAEGIEQADQEQQLCQLGCDFGQGFLWSKAMPDTIFQQQLPKL